MITKRATQKQIKRPEYTRKESGDHMSDLMRLVDSFFYDARVPLTFMKVPLENLLSDSSLDPKVREQIQIIHLNTERLLRLIRELKVWLQREKEGKQLRVSEGDIVKFVDGSISNFNHIAEERNIDFQVYVNTEDRTRGWFDSNLLERILYNFLSYIFESSLDGAEIFLYVRWVDGTSPAGGPNGSNSGGSRLLFEASGVSRHAQSINWKQVFEQLKDNEPTIDLETSGIQLIKNLVDLHRGSIHIQEEEGDQLCFQVSIPIDKSAYHVVEWIDSFAESPAEAAGEEKDISPPLPPDIPDLERMIEDAHKEATILVVDDNQEMRELLLEILESDYKVITAGNGQEGMEKTFSQYPDLVLTDLLMPVMDGVQMCKEIKSNEMVSHTPVILLTAVDTMDQKLRGLETGANDYIEKPFHQQELMLKIRNLIDSSKQIKLRFLKDALMQPKDMKLGKTDREFLERAINIIEKNLDNNAFSVEDFADGMAMSKTQLNRKLQALTGLSPNGFDRSYRLKKAARYLIEEDLLVGEVSTLVGFNDPRYFSRTFRKVFGMTPREYAMKYRPKK